MDLDSGWSKRLKVCAGYFALIAETWADVVRHARRLIRASCP